MIETIRQGGSGRRHRLDRDEFRISGMIDLRTGPGSSEREPERLVSILDLELREHLVGQEIEIVERPSGQLAIEGLGTGLREATITVSHGKASVVEKNMFQIRSVQETTRWATVHREIRMPSEGDRHGNTAIRAHVRGDAKSGLEELVRHFKMMGVGKQAHQIIMSRPIQ